jgi:hypothetical protein
MPQPVALEQRLTERLLGAGLRGILFLVLVSVSARIAPKRVWSEVLDGNNLALSILLAAVAIALGMVVSVQ